MARATLSGLGQAGREPAYDGRIMSSRSNWHSPRVFISYAKEDRESAIRLYTDLKKRGAKPWLDSEDLVGGQEWEPEITAAIEECDFFVALLSAKSVNKRGYVQSEVRKALKVLDTIPEGRTFIIPVRLQICQPTHSRLQSLHWVDLFPHWDDGLQRIFVALELRQIAVSQNVKGPAAEAPDKVSTASGRRLNLNLSPEAYQEIEALTRQSGARSQVALFGQAITMMQFLMQEKQKGNKLIVERDGKPVEIVLPSL
jgi:hypothetical protein